MKRYVHTADAIFALILFAAFAVSILMVLTAGARSYQNVRSSVEARHSETTCVSYIVMKLRHYDDAACTVELGELEGTPALLLRETIEGEDYVTAIYYHDGYVREIYAESSLELTLDEGFQIVEAQTLTLTSPSAGLYSVACVGTGGGEASATVSMRDWRAA
ncbi:MAG: DUF4860 domain-containing protein [Clostridiales bacterium]|nr:DUF4860 domain-containing protein [Clostridiales bacterium]